MILEQLRDAVRNRLGTPENENFYLAQQLDDLLNEAVQTISADGTWSWYQSTENISTSVGVRSYIPNVNWERTLALSIDGYDTMTYLSLAEIRNYPDESQGVPQAFTIFEERLYVAPAPSGIYTMRHDYIRSEPKMIDSTDQPIIPSAYHYAIIAMASHLAHLRSGDLPRAQAAQQEYNAWLKRMEGQKLRTTGTLKVRVRPGRDF